MTSTPAEQALDWARECTRDTTLGDALRGSAVTEDDAMTLAELAKRYPGARRIHAALVALADWARNER